MHAAYAFPRQQSKNANYFGCFRKTEYYFYPIITHPHLQPVLGQCFYERHLWVFQWFCGCVVQLVCRNVSLRVTSPHIVRYASRNDQNVPRRRLCWPLQFGQYQVPMSRSRMQKCRNHFFVINSAVYAPIYFKYIPQCFSSSAEFCFPVKTCKILQHY